MAGRAGRRGKDKTGNVFIYLNGGMLYYYQDLPEKLDELMNKPAETL